VPSEVRSSQKYGYRLIVARDGDRVRLFTRGGYDWSHRYPWIVESALRNRQKQFVIDGEAVILGVDGIADFDALHSGKQDHELQLYAFDMLAGDGDDMRGLPLSMRKTNLAPRSVRALASLPKKHTPETSKEKKKNWSLELSGVHC
jgi:bifunctional non-homologous end joining protein LigD